MNSTRLIAHPEYYDYCHTITFLDDRKIELFYGECQGARYEAVGDYSMDATMLIITNLKDVDDDNNSDRNDGENKVSNKDTDISDNEKALSKSETTSVSTSGQLGTMVYNFRKETGDYEWIEELTDRKRSASERYIFDQDPCGVDGGQVIFYKI